LILEIIVHRYLTALTFPYLTFLNCNFINLDFRFTYFIEWEFNNLYMSGACFTKYQVIGPKFNKMLHLSILTIYDSKIQKSKKWIEVECWDNVEEIINKLKD
jgi:hypothetical protein